MTLAQCTEDAERTIIIQAQTECFPQSMVALRRNRELPESSGILPLAPFLDQGMIRVGGRLRHSPLLYCERHPILLPANHRVTQLILTHYHGSVCHQGRHLTIAALRQAGYHIHQQRSVVGKFISSCVLCRKLRGKLGTQLMGDLPQDRLEQIPPFFKTGVDVFGPYQVHDGRRTRKTPGTKKTWVLLFTCLYSRAVHVEIISSIDTPTFQLALRRFTAVRGHCQLFRSDRGTNFQGAANQMKGELDLEELVGDAASESYTWEFLPPGASHMAGVWERKVQGVKRVFDAALAEANHPSLSREEFHTLICEAAAIVNATPLGEISSDPSEPFPVCPAALLTLREKPFPSWPAHVSQTDLLCYGQRRWRRVQGIADIFWQLWRQDYLYSLTARRKWLKAEENLSTGDIVLLNDKSARNNWPMGMVVAVHPISDDRVRKATVRLRPTAAGGPRTLLRAVHDLVIVLRVSERCSGDTSKNHDEVSHSTPAGVN